MNETLTMWIRSTRLFLTCPPSSWTVNVSDSASEYDPGFMYYFLSTVADVAANPRINSSAVYFQPNMAYTSSYKGFFNKTLPLFAPRAFRLVCPPSTLTAVCGVCRSTSKPYQVCASCGHNQSKIEPPPLRSLAGLSTCLSSITQGGDIATLLPVLTLTLLQLLSLFILRSLVCCFKWRKEVIVSLFRYRSI